MQSNAAVAAAVAAARSNPLPLPPHIWQQRRSEKRKADESATSSPLNPTLRAAQIAADAAKTLRYMQREHPQRKSAIADLKDIAKQATHFRPSEPPIDREERDARYKQLVELCERRDAISELESTWRKLPSNVPAAETSTAVSAVEYKHPLARRIAEQRARHVKLLEFTSPEKAEAFKSRISDSDTDSVKRMSRNIDILTRRAEEESSMQAAVAAFRGVAAPSSAAAAAAAVSPTTSIGNWVRTTPMYAPAAAAVAVMPSLSAVAPVVLSDTEREQTVRQILAHADDGSTATTADLEHASTEQLAVLVEIVVFRRSLFFSGCAGTGKSFIIQLLRKLKDPESTFFTAFTGLAAIQIGGTTLSSYAGVGLAQGTKEKLFELKKNNKKVKERWQTTRLLVIDEISTVSGHLFDCVLHFAQQFNRNEAHISGGIQIVASGDFLQLPPVKAEKLAFQSENWNKLFPKGILLSQIFRQDGDPLFANMLTKLRVGELGIKEEAMLKKAQYTKMADCHGVLPSTLFARKHETAVFNASRLEALDSPLEIFKADDSFSDEAQMTLLNKDCLAVASLQLKRGAQVMLLKNINTAKGQGNGTMAVVTDFVTNFETGERAPKVVCANGSTLVLEMESWEIAVKGRVVARRRQFPLLLAWALTIHKCQGLTLEQADITAQGIFEDSQLYVAVSRVKTLTGLRLRGFTRDCLRVNPVSVAWHKEFERASLPNVDAVFKELLQ
jgi:DNA replication protein DnaC